MDPDFSTTIWKYRLAVTDRQIIEVPVGALGLTVQIQGETPTLWMLVQPDKKRTTLGINCYGTGNPGPDVLMIDKRYLGTVQADLGLVWHFFRDYNYGATE